MRLVAERENEENTAEALILLREPSIQLHVDNETQTCQAEITEIATQLDLFTSNNTRSKYPPDHNHHLLRSSRIRSQE